MPRTRHDEGDGGTVVRAAPPTESRMEGTTVRHVGVAQGEIGSEVLTGHSTTPRRPGRVVVHPPRVGGSRDEDLNELKVSPTDGGTGWYLGSVGTGNWVGVGVWTVSVVSSIPRRLVGQFPWVGG